ncbi:hypothetical protein Kassivere_00104 [Pseudomonas phage vB_PpuM-Kassivere]
MSKIQISDVSAFRGHAVVGGVVQVTDDQMVAHLNDTYGQVVVCNVAMNPGDVVHNIANKLFRGLKADYQDELQASLEGQLVSGNDVDIDFH